MKNKRVVLLLSLIGFAFLILVGASLYKVLTTPRKKVTIEVYLEPDKVKATVPVPVPVTVELDTSKPISDQAFMHCVELDSLARKSGHPEKGMTAHQECAAVSTAELDFPEKK